MSKIIRYLPELEGEEQLRIAQLITDMTEEQANHFAHVYRQRRKDATVTMIMALVGFLGLAGIQRFFLGQTGMGLLYVLTGGLCFIGTLIDVINHKSMTAKFNIGQATEVAQLIHGAFPDAPRAPKSLEAPPDA